MRRALFTLSFLLAALPAWCQWTQVTASKITDGRFPVSGQQIHLLGSGRICFTVSDAQGNAIPYKIGGGGQGTLKPYCFGVSNGAIASGATVPDSALTAPVAAYKIEVFDNSVQPQVIRHDVTSGGIVNGSSWSYDDYTPNVGNVATSKSADSFAVGTLHFGDGTEMTTASGPGGGTSVTLKTNGTNNASQTTLNLQSSSANAAGLSIVTANSSGGNVQFEIQGTYTGSVTESQVTGLTPDLAAKVPNTRTVNSHALSADVTVTKSDIGLGNVQNVDQTNGSNIISGTVNYARLPLPTSGGAPGVVQAKDCSALGSNYVLQKINTDGTESCLAVSTGGSMTWPGSAGIAVYAGSSAWGTSLTAPSGAIVGTTDTQTLTHKDLTDATNTFPTLNQNTTGTAANVIGTVAIANGGTGQTTQQAAMDALAGTQSSGKVLRSDGTHTALSNIQAGDVPTLNQNTTGTAAGLAAQYIDWNASSGGSSIANKPTIPAAQIQSDWTQSNNTLADYIKNKPSIPAAQVAANLSSSGSTGVTGTLPIANGGTGQTTQQAAIDALTGTQSSGKYGRSDGTHFTLSNIQAGDVPTLNQNTTGTAGGLSANIAESQVTNLPADLAAKATQVGVQAQSYTAATDTGAANAYAITLSPVPTIGTNSRVQFKAANSNTGASTLAVNGGTATAIKKWSSGSLVALASGDITAGQMVDLQYDGTQWQMLSGGGGGGGLSGMTAGQIPLAATATTVTSSIAKYGSGAGIPTSSDPGTTPGILMVTDGSHGIQPSTSNGQPSLINFTPATVGSGGTLAGMNTTNSPSLGLGSTVLISNGANCGDTSVGGGLVYENAVCTAMSGASPNTCSIWNVFSCITVVPTWVRGGSGSAGANTTTASFTSNNAGDLLVVAYEANIPSGSAVSCTLSDTKGNTYLTASGFPFVKPTAAYQQYGIYYVANAPASAGTNTVTVTCTGATFTALSVNEYQRVAVGTPDSNGMFASQASATTTLSVGPLTETVGDLVVAWGAGAATINPGSGWTGRQSPSYTLYEDQISTSTSVTATETQTSNGFGIAILAFHP